MKRQRYSEEQIIGILKEETDPAAQVAEIFLFYDLSVFTQNPAGAGFEKSDNKVKQRALAASARPREHHELVAWDVHGDVFEVVLTRSSDADLAKRCGGRRTLLPVGSALALPGLA